MYTQRGIFLRIFWPLWEKIRRRIARDAAGVALRRAATMSRWLGEGGGGLAAAYHTNLQVNSNNNSKSNSYHGEHYVHADLFNVSVYRRDKSACFEEGLMFLPQFHWICRSAILYTYINYLFQYIICIVFSDWDKSTVNTNEYWLKTDFVQQFHYF